MTTTRLGAAIWLASISFLWAQAPQNNNYANAIALTSTNWVFVQGSNVNATKEPGERNHSTGGYTGNQGGKSVWWTWKPPATGQYLISTVGSDFDTLLAVYTGSNPSNGASIVAADTNSLAQVAFATNRKASVVAFTGTPNNTYKIAVDGVSNVTGIASGNIALNIWPNNDMLASNLLVVGEYLCVTGINVKATPETSEPDHVVGSACGKSIWFRWSPPRNGDYMVHTIGSTFNTVLALYTNTASPPTIAGLRIYNSYMRNDDDGQPGILTSLLGGQDHPFSARTNMTYYFAVDGKASSAIATDQESGLVVLNVQPDNNRYTNRILLSGTNVSGLSANGQALAESSEGNLMQSATASAFDPPNPNSRSVWWEWIAPTNGIATVDTFGSFSEPEKDLDTLLAVYIGTSSIFTAGSDIRMVGWNNNAEQGFTSQLAFGVLPGVSYKIQVQGNYDPPAEDEAFGQIYVHVSFVPGPANDLFANRIVLPGTNQLTVYGSSVNATFEPRETNQMYFVVDPTTDFYIGRTVWWSWTAPSDGDVTLSTLGSDFNTVLGVFTGTTLSNLALVVRNDDDVDAQLLTSLTNFNATAGTTYHIVVGGPNTAEGADNAPGGNIVLSLIQISAPPNDNFEDRIALPSSDVVMVTNGTSLNATKEPGEPQHGGPGGRSVWWTWTAPFSGLATISTAGSDFNTMLGVYTGTGVSNLTLVATNNDIGAESFSAVAFNATLGQAYQIAVDGEGDEGGDVQLRITLSLPLRTGAWNAQLDGTFQLGFTSQLNHRYDVYAADELLSTNWTVITTLPLVGNGGTLLFTDPTAPDSNHRFYRIVEDTY